MIRNIQTTMNISDNKWNKIFPKNIYLFAGGRSSLTKLNEDLDGLKIVINLGYAHCNNFDILFWGDKIVGDKLASLYAKKPTFRLVALKNNGGLAKDWVDEYYSYNFGVFTVVWALMWLKEKYPNSKIYIYGLDGDGVDYYDDVIEQPKLEERVRRIQICYGQLDKLPKENIYNCNPNSQYKGFEFC